MISNEKRPNHHRSMGPTDATLLPLSARSVIHLVSFCLLPELTIDGELPPGVHTAGWEEFISRFGGSSPRRLWLSGRLRTILELAASGGRLHRAFVWGSFVTAKPSPRDLDILLIMGDDLRLTQMATSAQAVFDSTRAKLQFESDVFWA